VKPQRSWRYRILRYVRILAALQIGTVIAVMLTGALAEIYLRFEFQQFVPELRVGVPGEASIALETVGTHFIFVERGSDSSDTTLASETSPWVAPHVTAVSLETGDSLVIGECPGSWRYYRDGQQGTSVYSLRVSHPGQYRIGVVEDVDRGCACDAIAIAPSTNYYIFITAVILFFMAVWTALVVVVFRGLGAIPIFRDMKRQK